MRSRNAEIQRDRRVDDRVGDYRGLETGPKNKAELISRKSISDGGRGDFDAVVARADVRVQLEAFRRLPSDLEQARAARAFRLEVAGAVARKSDAAGRRGRGADAGAVDREVEILIGDTLVIGQEFQRAFRRLARGRAQDLRGGRKGRAQNHGRDRATSDELGVIQEVDETGDDLLSQRRVGR
jgi:hypothetical protein